MQGDEESGIIQKDGRTGTAKIEQTTENATAQASMTAQEKLALSGTELLDKGGMPSDAQLAAMGMDEATARGIQSLVWLATEGDPAARRAVEAMTDLTAQKMQVEQSPAISRLANEDRTAVDFNPRKQQSPESEKNGIQGYGYAKIDPSELNASIEHIEEFVQGKRLFDDVVDDYAKVYANVVCSNQVWSWDTAIPGGTELTKNQKSVIKQRSVKVGLIPNVQVSAVEGLKYGFSDFESAGVVRETKYLPNDMWKMTDTEQFRWLDKQIGGTVKGYTWHHTEIPGKMQLVPTGLHGVTAHNGGRTTGLWADAKR